MAVVSRSDAFGPTRPQMAVDPEPPRLEPVMIEVVRGCHFKARGCGRCGLPKSNRAHGRGGGCEFRRRNGCDRCGGHKGDEVHLGAPPSFNVMASGVGASSPMIYATQKKRWQGVLASRLAASSLPRGLARVVVEGEVTFPDRARRDQGNYRVLVEKALGDALVHGGGEVPGGWLEDDDWSRFEFGNLTQVHEAGRSATRLVLFPALALPDGNSGAIVGAVPDGEDADDDE